MSTIIKLKRLFFHRHAQRGPGKPRKDNFPSTPASRLPTGIAFLVLIASATAATTRLEELDLTAMTSGWGKPQVNLGVGGEPFAVGGELFEGGIGTHAPSSWKLSLAGKATEFRARVGVNDGSPGKVEFIVRGDGKDLFRSGPMRGGDAAKPVRVNLTGVNQLELDVDPLGETTSDHADWVEPVIAHEGAPLPTARPKPPEEALLPDQPGEPPNAGAVIQWEEKSGALSLSYDGKTIFGGQCPGAKLAATNSRKNQAVTQTITLTGTGLKLEGVVNTDNEAIAAETMGAAQKAFPLVRTSVGGPSRNLRNNSIYERQHDWLLAGPEAQTRLEPQSTNQFKLICAGDRIELVFQPRFYQRHKNISEFRPWTYAVRKDSITGWSSWWAYMRKFTQRDLEQLLAVWQNKHFADYGYRFIQIDDCFQGGTDGGRKMEPMAYGYPGGRPETWLDWRRDLFPSGMAGYAAACRNAGFDPGIWIGSQFADVQVVEQHPDWFVQGRDGKPYAGPWVGYSVDATIPEAADAIVRPTYRGVHQADFSYVKIDILRHRLYDNLNLNPEYCTRRGFTPAEIFRAYLKTAREELGPSTFILSCWGVLPESVGIADACRIGGDGYGPVTLQQYNSWNGIVWRNDPDHCDVLPHFKPAEAGNVTKTTKVQAAAADTVIRPALASIAGCLLMLSDRPAVYEDEANLEGLRRAAPVLFSVPGQLYDFDPSKSRNLVTRSRTSITSGAKPSPIDADQFGRVCPWWLNEFNFPFEHWNVLHQLNWTEKATEKSALNFASIGLAADKTFLVYEFWSHNFLGSFRGQVELPALKPMGLASYAIREQVDHPQIVSTSRHLSQGGVDLVSIEWSGEKLTGRSRVVAGDRYELTLHVPQGYKLQTAQFGQAPAEVITEGEIARVAFTPTATGVVDWNVAFNKVRR